MYIPNKNYMISIKAGQTTIIRRRMKTCKVLNLVKAQNTFQ